MVFEPRPPVPTVDCRARGPRQLLATCAARDFKRTPSRLFRAAGHWYLQNTSTPRAVPFQKRSKEGSGHFLCWPSPPCCPVGSRALRPESTQHGRRGGRAEHDWSASGRTHYKRADFNPNVACAVWEIGLLNKIRRVSWLDGLFAREAVGALGSRIAVVFRRALRLFLSRSTRASRLCVGEATSAKCATDSRQPTADKSDSHSTSIRVTSEPRP